MNILSGPDALGQKVVEHDGTQHITFAGSAATGNRVMQTASVTLKKVTLELDGNDPAVVFPNANILKEAAPKIFQRAAMNNGQVSVAIMRDFLHGNQYDEMIATLKEEAGS